MDINSLHLPARQAPQRQQLPALFLLLLPGPALLMLPPGLQPDYAATKDPLSTELCSMQLSEG